jgi:hypothetical protein
MKRLAIFLTVVALTGAIAWGQATAQIHGTIQDATGAAVPGADVKATQTGTGLSRTVTSDADGGFVLTNLPLGPYRLEVGKQGFTTAVQTGIVLQVGSDPAVNVALKVGQVTEQVNVEANAALVETRSSGVGEVIQNQRIVELPLNGRNVTDLIGLAGASVQTGNSQTRWYSGLPVVSIGGSVAAGGSGGVSLLGTEYILDGANHVNFLNGGTMPLAFPDAVQEFKAETSGQSAQRGASPNRAPMNSTATCSHSSATTDSAARANISRRSPAPISAISSEERSEGRSRRTRSFSSVATRAPPSARRCPTPRRFLPRRS